MNKNAPYPTLLASLGYVFGHQRHDSGLFAGGLPDCYGKADSNEIRRYLKICDKHGLSYPRRYRK